MNTQLKTILLTVLTLSIFVIALVELSGVSSTALFNKYGIGNGGTGQMSEGTPDEQLQKDAQRKAMPKTTISFDDTKHSFGTITDGEVVKHAYKFKNTGEHPLLISNAVASCGCTVPSYPKEPIPPGGEGEILVEFNSKNRVGHQQKNVLIYSNAQEEAMSIGFDVDVKEK
ncbi:MAG: hypothetical protein K0R82_472 [Flavipsychrobacter sp.]|jgi:hypothetical protein|nr:hypothetical protein [Flavipsychrobacter sp.]